MGSPATSLRIAAFVRILYGLFALFAPKRMFASMGFDDPEPEARYFNALFGGRDIVVGVWTLKAVGDGDLDQALLANAGCEATDMVALVQEVRHRGGLDRATAAGIGFNVVGWANVIGIALRRDR